MPIPKQVDRAYVRRRAGQELYLNDRPLNLQTLIESIEEDFRVRISLEEARQLFVKHMGENNRAELEQEFVGAMRELGIENPEFVRRLKSISIKQL